MGWATYSLLNRGQPFWVPAPPKTGSGSPGAPSPPPGEGPPLLAARQASALYARCLQFISATTLTDVSSRRPLCFSGNVAFGASIVCCNYVLSCFHAQLSQGIRKTVLSSHCFKGIYAYSVGRKRVREFASADMVLPNVCVCVCNPCSHRVSFEV